MKKYILHILNLSIFALFLAGYSFGTDTATYMIPLQLAVLIANAVFAKNKKQLTLLNFLLTIASIGGFRLGTIFYQSGISRIQWSNIWGDIIVLSYMWYFPAVMLIVTVIELLFRRFCKIKTINRLVLCIALMAEICTVICWCGRYGWKAFGFKLCENPEICMILDVKTDCNLVRIAGDTSVSTLYYTGYTHKIKDNTLYIGIKHSWFPLFPEREKTGEYYINLCEDMTDIEKIILTDGNSENDKCIWERDKDKFYLEKIKVIRLYGNAYADSENYAENLKDKAFEYADSELLEKVHHAELSTGFVMTKDGGSCTAVAELDDGSQILLRFSSNDDIFWIDSTGEVYFMEWFS